MTATKAVVARSAAMKQARGGYAALRADFDLGEEEGDLLRRVFRRIRAVHRIGLDRLGEILADRAGGGLGRVGRAHYVAVLRDRILALEHLYDDRARNHEIDQAAIERPLGMDRVEALCRVLGEPETLLRDDAEALALEPVVDRAGQIAPGRVRLDDRQGTFDGHGRDSMACGRPGVYRAIRAAAIRPPDRGRPSFPPPPRSASTMSDCG